MSTNTIEKVLYDLSVNKELRTCFKNDADSVLARYPLAPGEGFLIKEQQVARMKEQGVNPMLTMGFWMMMKGPQALGEYLAAMRNSAKEKN